jgi:hypothetical protein
MAVEHRDMHTAVGTGPSPQRTLLIGLLADPGLPTMLAEDLARRLPEKLADQPEPGTRYRFSVVTESLRRRGDARGQRLIDLAAERAAQEGWDFALALTDLPVHKDEQPVVAELSRTQMAALLVVTAVNPLKPAEETREIAAGVILEWAARERSDGDTRPLLRLEDRSPNLRPMEPEDDDVDLRVTRSAGPLWTLAGMVRVNRPWRLVLGLRGALAASVATAAFGLVSSPVWQVSGAISTVRLCIATAVSTITMIGWLILNHGLWQHTDHRDDRHQIRLYNAATVLTLTIGVLVSYLVLLAGNVMTAWFIVIPEVFSGYLRRPVEFLDYLRLAWLVASLATIGGALGSGLESSDAVRSATWGSRYRHDHRHRPSKEKRQAGT